MLHRAGAPGGRGLVRVVVAAGLCGHGVSSHRRDWRLAVARTPSRQRGAGGPLQPHWSAVIRCRAATGRRSASPAAIARAISSRRGIGSPPPVVVPGGPAWTAEFVGALDLYRLPSLHDVRDRPAGCAADLPCEVAAAHPTKRDTWPPHVSASSGGVGRAGVVGSSIPPVLPQVLSGCDLGSNLGFRGVDGPAAATTARSAAADGPVSVRA